MRRMRRRRREWRQCFARVSRATDSETSAIPKYDVRMSWKPISALLIFAACTGAPPMTETHDQKLFIGGVVAAGPQQAPQRNWAIYVRDGRVEALGPAA